MKFLVQFYSIYAQKFVSISSHKTLSNAVKRARKEYVEGTYAEVTILFISKDGEETRLTKYGTEEFDAVDYGL